MKKWASEKYIDTGMSGNALIGQLYNYKTLIRTQSDTQLIKCRKYRIPTRLKEVDNQGSNHEVAEMSPGSINICNPVDLGPVADHQDKFSKAYIYFTKVIEQFGDMNGSTANGK